MMYRYLKPNPARKYIRIRAMHINLPMGLPTAFSKKAARNPWMIRFGARFALHMRNEAFTKRNDRSTVYKRDKKNRIIEKADLEGTEKNRFDYGGNLTSFSDKNGNTYRYQYGKTCTITNPLGETTSITFDDNGNVTEEKKPDGGTWT